MSSHFSTPLQLKLLKTAKRWYVDGTFKLVKVPFVQLFSIHVFIRSHTTKDILQVPVCFIFMSRRTTSDYKSVFEFLKKKIGKCAVKEIVSDFEKGILNGLRLVFKKVSFHGCAFHWTQALFRRLLKYEGLSKLLNKDTTIMS
jgi:hypothetical protein